jgi:glycosyltransferase involved in cell wall biosynthesis
MRVGIITDSPYDAPLGYSIRPRELSTNLARLGCEVNVFSPVDKCVKISENLMVNGIHAYQAPFAVKFHGFVRKAFKSPLTARYLYRKRVLHMLSKQLAESVYAKVKSCKIEVLQGEKEIASMAAAILGKRLGIPVVADIHGLLAEEAIQSGFLEKDSKEYLESRAFVSRVLHESDAVVVVSENLKYYLAKDFDIGNDEIFVVPNAGTPREVTRPSRRMPRKIVYAGILEPWERVDLAIASIPHVIKFHVMAKFFIAGRGSLKEDLIKFANHLKVNGHVSFVGTITYDKVAGFLAQGDIAVLPSTIDVVRKVACPIKLFDYFASGLPIITVDGLWWSDFVKLNNVGLVADADPKSFADATNDLLSSPDKINAMGENAIRLVREKYNWTEMAKKLLETYEKIL